MRKILIECPRHVRRRLQRRMGRIKDAALKTRIQIVLLYAKGWGANTISEALVCAPATAIRVAQRFLTEGEDGLEDRRKENGEAKVDEDLLQALAEIVQESPEDYGWQRPTWTRELMARVLRDETGVRVSISTIGRMLRMLGARWGMARPTVVCPWSKVRKSRRIRKILKIVENLPTREVAYYQDEVDIHLNPKIGRDWMLSGQQKIVVTPGQNQKRYLAGALSVDGRDLIFVSSDRKNSDLFIKHLEKIQKSNPRARRIHLVLDNYKIHSSKKVHNWLAAQGDLFVLHFLPPYSPDHNKIERFWRDLHENVTRNHRCKSMEDLLQNVIWYLRKEQRRRRRKPSPKTRTHRKVG